MSSSSPEGPRPTPATGWPPTPPLSAVLSPGSRVSLRRRLPEGGLGDVVGEVVGDVLGLLPPPGPNDAVTPPGVVKVRRRSGEVVTVALADIVAARRVPPPPPRRLRVDPDEILRVAADTWPAAVEERWGRWRLRASGGFTRRANACYPVGGVAGAAAPGDATQLAAQPLAQTLEQLRGWYERRGLPPQVVAPVGGDLERVLPALGWASELRLLELVASADDAHRLLVDALQARAVTERPEPSLSAELGAGWLRLARDLTLAEATTAVRAVLVPPPASGVAVRLATLGPADEPLAVGRVAVSGRWASVAALKVAPAARRQGHALHVMLTLVTWAREQGAEFLHLQVDTGNTAALRLYERVGFTVALEQRWWHPSGSAA